MLIASIVVAAPALTGNGQSGKRTVTPSRPSTPTQPMGTDPATADEPRRDNKWLVQPGDTLWDIAEQTGVSINQLEALNPGLTPTTLRIGQEVLVRR